jgi:hypothetical protein
MYWGASLPESYQERLPVWSREKVLAECRTERERTDLDGWLVTRRGKNGRPMAEVRMPVVDIRAAGPSCAKELIKYLLKDAERDASTNELRYVDPKLYAQVYKVFSNTRSIYTSKGFWVREEREACCPNCGTEGEWRRFVVGRKELGWNVGHALASLGAFSRRGSP